MANTTDDNAGMDFRLPVELKQLIEEAAALRGQAPGDFAVSTLMENAQRVIHQHRVTELTNRDRDIFLALLDDENPHPSDAVMTSAESYKDWVRRNEE
jgi:uncharacterized protein (DUF1778 family)